MLITIECTLTLKLTTAVYLTCTRLKCKFKLSQYEFDCTPCLFCKPSCV